MRKWKIYNVIFSFKDAQSEKTVCTHGRWHFENNFQSHFQRFAKVGSVALGNWAKNVNRRWCQQGKNHQKASGPSLRTMNHKLNWTANHWIKIRSMKRDRDQFHSPVSFTRRCLTSIGYACRFFLFWWIWCFCLEFWDQDNVIAVPKSVSGIRQHHLRTFSVRFKWEKNAAVLLQSERVSTTATLWPVFWSHSWQGENLHEQKMTHKDVSSGAPKMQTAGRSSKWAATAVTALIESGPRVGGLLCMDLDCWWEWKQSDLSVPKMEPKLEMSLRGSRINSENYVSFVVSCPGWPGVCQFTRGVTATSIFVAATLLFWRHSDSFSAFHWAKLPPPWRKNCSALLFFKPSQILTHMCTSSKTSKKVFSSSF